jgi:predicted ester cyclase
MSIKENKELLLQQLKDWNELGGDVSKIRPLMDKYSSPHYVFHHSLSTLNFEQKMQFVIMLYTTYPDLYGSADDILAEGDKVVMRYTYKCTHKGVFMGIPTTGKQASLKPVEIYKIVIKKSLKIGLFLMT